MLLTEKQEAYEKQLIKEISENLDSEEIDIEQAADELLELEAKNSPLVDKEVEIYKRGRGNKFTQEERNKIVGWLCAGLSNSELVKLVADNFSKEISWQLINQYRRTHSKKISEMEQQSRDASKYIGYSKISTRIKALEGLVALILSKFDENDDWDARSSRLVTDLGKVISMLQQHLGEEMVGNTVEASSGNAKIVTTLVIPSFDNKTDK